MGRFVFHKRFAVLAPFSPNLLLRIVDEKLFANRRVAYLFHEVTIPSLVSDVGEDELLWKTLPNWSLARVTGTSCAKHKKFTIV